MRRFFVGWRKSNDWSLNKSKFFSTLVETRSGVQWEIYISILSYQEWKRHLWKSLRVLRILHWRIWNWGRAHPKINDRWNVSVSTTLFKDGKGIPVISVKHRWCSSAAHQTWAPGSWYNLGCFNLENRNPTNTTERRQKNGVSFKCRKRIKTETGQGGWIKIYDAAKRKQHRNHRPNSSSGNK